jgi:hypothetical protein
MNGSHYNTIDQNEIINPTGSAIQVGAGQWNTVVDNRIFGGANDSIDLRNWVTGGYACSFNTVRGNVISKSGGDGINLKPAVGALTVDENIIAENIILNPNGHPIILNNAQRNVITGNIIDGGAAASSGVNLSGGANENVVVANRIRNSPNGITVNTPAQNVVADNVVVGNTLAITLTSLGAGNWVTNNVGFNPQAIAAITVTASPFTYTNTDGYPELVTVLGGTVSIIALGGVTITNATSGVFTLTPGQSIAVTYSVAPAMQKIPI